MPYRVKGKIVLHKKNGKWTVKQVAKSHKNAVRTVALLRAVEHGWKPSHKRKKRR